MAATMFDERPTGSTGDAIDQISARPDVAVAAVVHAVGTGAPELEARGGRAPKEPNEPPPQ